MESGTEYYQFDPDPWSTTETVETKVTLFRGRSFLTSPVSTSSSPPPILRPTRAVLAGISRTIMQLLLSLSCHPRFSMDDALNLWFHKAMDYCV